jgi:hypothetical protein
MAKSLRSSRLKVNKSKLRENVNGPTEKARAERLSAKLQEIISAAKAKDIEMKDLEEGRSRILRALVSQTPFFNLF